MTTYGSPDLSEMASFWLRLMPLWGTTSHESGPRYKARLHPELLALLKEAYELGRQSMVPSGDGEG